MRKFTLFFMAMLCAVGVRAAVTITADGSNGVIVKADNAGEFQNYTPTADELALLKGRSTLKLQGNFNGNDLSKFRDHQAVSATTVDFGDATFEKNSWNENSSQTFQYWQDAKHFVMSKTETNKVTKESLWMYFNGNKPPIETIEINGAIDVEGGMFAGRTTLKSVKFGPNVGTIGSDAFNGCSNLTTLDLGGVQDIGYQAFAGCSMTELTIPGTVKHIGENAFINCDDITEIVFQEHLDENGKSDVEMVIEPLAFRQADKIWNIYINVSSM